MQDTQDEDREEARSGARRLTLGYLTALMVIAILAAGSHVLIQRQLDHEIGTAATINVAGRQRMLAERVAWLSNQMVFGLSPAEREGARTPLGEALATLENDHYALLHGDARRGLRGKLSPELRQMFFDPPMELDVQIKSFVAAGRRLLEQPITRLLPDDPDLASINVAARGLLLESLDRSVLEYQIEAEHRLDLLNDLQLGLLALLLAVLLVEAALVFRPLALGIERQQRRLAEARSALQSMFDSVPEAVFVLGDDLEIQHVNGSAALMWRSDRNLLVRRRIATLIEDCEAPLRAMIRGESRHPRQTLMGLRPDGSRFPLECHLARHSGGGWLLSGRDVTEEQEQDRRLRLYESAFLNSSDSILIFQRSPAKSRDAIAYVNPAFSRLCGLPPARVIGGRIGTLLALDAPQDLRDRIQQAFAARSADVCEVPLRHRDGHVFWAELTLVPGQGGRDQADHMVATLRDITERREREQRTWQHAHLDPLTSLPNRRLFHETLTRTIEEAARDSSLTALMFIDLDGFKAVNDRHGHDAGDALLVAVAQRCSAAVRGHDVVSRLAGDEFTAICPRIEKAEEAGAIAARLIERLREPVNVPGGTVRVGASIGIALFPLDAVTAERLTKLADDAMYAAKSAGRNCYRFVPALKQSSTG